jgi:hypothetical protein
MLQAKPSSTKPDGSISVGTVVNRTRRLFNVSAWIVAAICIANVASGFAGAAFYDAMVRLASTAAEKTGAFVFAFVFVFVFVGACTGRAALHARAEPPPSLTRRAAGPDGADTAESLQAFRPFNANPKPLTNPHRFPLHTNPKHRTNPHRFPPHTNPESSQTPLAADHKTAARCCQPARPSALRPARLRGRRAAGARVRLHLRQAIIPLRLQ